MSPLPILGIVGGIGSGKSTLARWVADHHPVAVIDADRLGHEVLQHPAVIAQLRQALGADIVDSNGQVLRSVLAACVFGDTLAHHSAREQLEAIVHPAIGREVERQIAALDPAMTKCVLLDAAVLLEAGWRDRCDGLIFIDTPEDRRRAWVAARGWSPAELARREASQWPLERKRQAADAAVANDGTVEEAGERLWQAVEALLNR
jgi:dephospho-CoA kinase